MPKNNRTVYTNTAEVLSVGIGSGLLVGDLDNLTPQSWVIAVQKEGADFFPADVDFSDYSIFRRDTPPPLSPISINTFTYHDSPICVDNVWIRGASTASTLQIGGTEHIYSRSRVKHIRILSEEQ